MQKEKVVAFIKANKALSITWGILLLIGVGVGGHLLLNAHFNFRFHFPASKKVKTQVPTVSPDQQIQQKKADLIASVSAQIKLPTDEDPILATVSDKNQLQNQDFFKQAQDGDKILMYPKNKKAFLYRPSINQVIAQAPLIYQDSSSDASVAAEATKSAQQQQQSKGPIPTLKPQGKVLYNNQ
ncbi:MAG: hypothetical protein ACREHC_08015 [Candidatus Levyibacteriota bacterium]